MNRQTLDLRNILHTEKRAFYLKNKFLGRKVEISTEPQNSQSRRSLLINRDNVIVSTKIV